MKFKNAKFKTGDKVKFVKYLHEEDDYIGLKVGDKGIVVYTEERGCEVKMYDEGVYFLLNEEIGLIENIKARRVENDIGFMQEKVNIHRKICEKMNETYRTKNNDYGDSYARVREEHKDLILIHLKEKLMRLDALYKGTEQLVNESVEDTLIDMANYCILELIELRDNHDSK